MEYQKIINLIDHKIACRITKFRCKIHNKTIQKQLKMRMIKKYLKTDIYL